MSLTHGLCKQSRPKLINKLDENVNSYRQRKREYESDKNRNVSTYPDIEEFTRQMDNFAAQWPKYTTPYTNSRSKGVVSRMLTRESTAEPLMSWLTSA